MSFKFKFVGLDQYKYERLVEIALPTPDIVDIEDTFMVLFV